MDANDQRRMYERMYGPFTHMGPEDAAIWVRYLAAGGNIHAPFSYDVRVGTGVKMPEGSSETAIAAAYALTTKRIDVLWNEGSRVTICELKKRAGATAIGQLILYGNLYRAQFPDNLPPRLLLITDQLQPDMKPTLIDAGIDFIEIGL